MRVRLLLVPAVVLTIVYACAGSSDHFTGGGTGTGVGGQAGDASIRLDAGSDAGTDAGTDAGCATPQLNLPSIDVFDNCPTNGSGLNPRTGSVISSGPCQVLITVDDGLNCSGVISGPANAFDGGCNTNLCQSPSLPGTLTCTLANSTQCNVKICPGPSGTACP